MTKKPDSPIGEEFLANLPTAPGVYLMKDAAGKIIYIGKAGLLRTRVRSYFRGGDERLSVAFLLSRVRDIECVVTPTEKEAVLLENTLIKKHKPRYNLRLRADNTYVSLRIDPRADFARFEVTRHRRKDGAIYLGPYSSAKSVRQTLQFVHRVFPLRQCSDSVMANRTRPCILHDIGKCCGPCYLPVMREEYARYVRGALLLLAGKREDVVRLLKEKMLEHSTALEFEKAATIRDKIVAINKTVERQRVAFSPDFNADVLAHHAERGRMCLALLSYREGLLNETQCFEDRDHGLPMDEVYHHFIAQYYDDTRGAPPLLLVDVEPNGCAALAECLAELRDGACEIRQPQRGEKARTVDIARSNARDRLARSLDSQRAAQDVLEDLQRKLRLPDVPTRIECYDISTFQGSASVASRVVFVEGEPSKGDYRRYRIRTVEGTDDFAGMRETLERRFRRLVDDEAKGESDRPDLVIVDGGIGQLNVAVDVLENLGLSDVSLVGLAKSRTKDVDDAGRRAKLMNEGARRRDNDSLQTAERLFLPGRKNPVLLRRNHPALYLVQRVRDEAHRFAITYHKNVRRKATIGSSLDAIPGVGPSRRRALLRHFGSLTKIREASVDEIAAVPGIPRPLAETVSKILSTKSNGENRS